MASGTLRNVCSTSISVLLFYLSTWAYAGYTVLALCSLAAVIIYFRKQTRQKHQQAMDKFEREKERELYTAKIDFFTNVAHEIRTPLTLIKSPLENVLVSQSVSDDIRMIWRPWN